VRPSVTVQVAAGSYADVLTELVDARVASRLAARDPTLWGPEAEQEAAIRLDWVDLPRSSRPLLAEIDALRAELWGEGIDRVVLCGMGGSSLAPEVITRTYGMDLLVLDSTEPSVVERALRGDLQRTVVVVSSKSGTTVETDSQRRAFEEAFARVGIDAASRMVAVTDPGSELAEYAAESGYRRVFSADPHVGGRYSALTAFGLVPSGLAGVDVAELLDEADDVAAALAADEPTNPALLLGAVLGGLPGDVTGGPQRRRDKIVIADADSGVTGLGDWAEQLIAESTGKQGRGVLPVPVEGPDAPEVLTAADDVSVAFVVDAIRAEDQPLVVVPEAAAGTPVAAVAGPLGGQLLLWETAAAVAGRLLGINPFDQPDVESAKNAARGLLDHQPAPEPAGFVEAAVEVRAPAGLLDGVGTLDGAVAALLDRVGDDGYVAVMAYLDPERDAPLRTCRAALARRTGRPVTFGWGPRFLHSTGQYHKGGPAQGAYLQLTTEASTDVPVPDRPFSFGTLVAAQAAGDARVLADHDRPVLRLHLREPVAGVAQVLEALR